MRHLMLNTRTIQILEKLDRAQEDQRNQSDQKKNNPGEKIRRAELDAVTRMIKTDIIARELRLGFEHEVQMSKF